MADTFDWVIPVSVIVSRLEKHYESTTKALLETPRWRIFRRRTLSGIAAAYKYEMDFILAWSAKQQPIMQSLFGEKKAGKDRIK